jgi:hypothetical protein
MGVSFSLRLIGKGEGSHVSIMHRRVNRNL